MLNNNDTSDLINFLVYSVESAAVFAAVLIIALYFVGPGAIKILRAEVIDPAIQQWNAPITGSVKITPTDNNPFFGTSKTNPKKK
jgi:hypothetical protein